MMRNLLSAAALLFVCSTAITARELPRGADKLLGTAVCVQEGSWHLEDGELTNDFWKEDKGELELQVIDFDELANHIDVIDLYFTGPDTLVIERKGEVLKRLEIIRPNTYVLSVVMFPDNDVPLEYVQVNYKCKRIP